MHKSLSNAFQEEITQVEAHTFEQFLRFVFELGEKYGIEDSTTTSDPNHPQVQNDTQNSYAKNYVTP